MVGPQHQTFVATYDAFHEYTKSHYIVSGMKSTN